MITGGLALEPTRAGHYTMEGSENSTDQRRRRIQVASVRRATESTHEAGPVSSGGRNDLTDIFGGRTIPLPLTSNVMPELTLEAIERMLDKKFDEKLAPLATKEDVRQAVGDLAGIVADTIAAPFTKRFDRLEELLEVKEDVLTLKRQMLEIRSALHLSA